MSSVAVAINLEEIQTYAIETKVAQDLGEPTRGLILTRFSGHVG